MKVDILGFIRSLSFGGLLGCGAAYITFLTYPQLFAGHTKLEAVVIFGSLLGAGLHRAVDALVVQGMLRPFGRSASYYAKLAELRLLKRKGLIKEHVCNQIEEEMVRKYFEVPFDKHAERKELQPTKESVKEPTKESVKD